MAHVLWVGLLALAVWFGLCALILMAVINLFRGDGQNHDSRYDWHDEGGE